MEGKHLDKEYEEKMISFEIDCYEGKGNPEACHEAAYFQQIVRNNKARAVKMFDQNCSERGYLLSCFNAARLHAAGKSVPQNIPLAIQQFKKACEGDVTPACFFYGSFLMENEDIKERERGLNLLVETCRKNEVQSCRTASNFYVDRNNPLRNPQFALEFLHIGCNRYDYESCHDLAVMYKKGDTGVEQNLDLANKYQKKTIKITNEMKRFSKGQKRLKQIGEMQSKSESGT